MAERCGGFRALAAGTILGDAALGRGATRRGKSLQWSDLSDETPEPMCHRPKTPIGRRGVSLTYIADYPRGANASPARRFAL